MELLTVLFPSLLFLITSSAENLKEKRDDSNKEHYESNILPRYSKSTPYLYEEQLPLPVYGIAHGYPYRKKEKDSTDDYPTESTQSSRRDDGDHTFHDELQKDTPEYPDDDKQYDEEYEADKGKSASREPEEEEQEDGNDDTAQEQGDESQEEEGDEEDAEKEPEEPGQEHNEQESEEENSHANAEPEQASSREEYDEEQEQSERHHRHRHPNGKQSKESGNGSDSEHSDSAHYEDSGRGKKRRYSGEQDSAENKRTRHRGPPGGKVVGVDMSMVAGIYPHQSKKHKSEIPGRYSPLSGPFPSYEHEETTTRSTPKPERKTRKYRKKHEQRGHTRSPDYSSNKNRSQKSKERAKWMNVQGQDDAAYAKTSQPIRYGPFDAYFVVRPGPLDRQQGGLKSFSKFPKGIQQQVSGTLSVKTPSGNRGYNEYPVDVVLQTRAARVEPQLDKPPQSTQLEAQDNEKVANYEKQTSENFDVQNSSNAPYTDPAVQNGLSDRRPLAYENEAGYRNVDTSQNNCPNCRWSTANMTRYISEHVPSKSSTGASMEAREPDEPPKPPPFDFRHLRHDEYVDPGVRTLSQIPPSTSEHSSELSQPASSNLDSTSLSPFIAHTRASRRW